MGSLASAAEMGPEQDRAMDCSIIGADIGLTTWTCKRLLDYSVIEHRLPVVEESVTQLERGQYSGDVDLLSADQIYLVRARHNVLSVGVTVLNPDFVSFVLFVSTTGECHINGEIVDPSAMYMPGGQNGYHILGGERDVIGVALPRRPFVETIAALKGVGPEDLSLSGHRFQLAPGLMATVRDRFIALLSNHASVDLRPARRQTPANLANSVLGVIADAYLAADAVATRRTGCGQSPEKTVRKAEERFMAAEGEPVSLADLCVAAGVGRTTLYAAFASVCGTSPAAFLRKRQLMQARSILLHAQPRRGNVTRAALEVGMTELGRFSVEYRRLFGEAPSVTLARSCEPPPAASASP